MKAPTYYWPTATGDPSGNPCSCAYQCRPADDPGLLAFEAGTAELPHADACAREAWRREVVALARVKLDRGLFTADEYAAAERFSARGYDPAFALDMAAQLEAQRLSLGSAMSST